MCTDYSISTNILFFRLLRHEFERSERFEANVGVGATSAFELFRTLKLQASDLSGQVITAGLNAEEQHMLAQLRFALQIRFDGDDKLYSINTTLAQSHAWDDRVSVYDINLPKFTKGVLDHLMLIVTTDGSCSFGLLRFNDLYLAAEEEKVKIEKKSGSLGLNLIPYNRPEEFVILLDWEDMVVLINCCQRYIL